MILIKNSIRLLFFTLWIFTNNQPGFAQENYFIGYKKSIGGTNFTYHSPFSNNEECLLVRARKEFDPVEWETEPVPGSYSEKTISFTWLYGMDVLPQSQSFDLYINDTKALTFSSPVSNEIKIVNIKGDGGVELTFNQSMIDKHKDQMGYAVLTIPAKEIKPGEPVRLKVDGIDNQSNAWYMTYKVSLKEKITASQLKTVYRKENQLWHTIRFNIVHLSEPSEVSMEMNSVEKSFVLKTGFNEIDFLLPRVLESTEYKANVTIKDRATQYFDLTLKPIKEWTIHLVQHTHTDIGYTRPQAEILAEHLRYIDYALDYCDQTDHYPENAQFRWTCEAAWTVREYLKARPKEQLDRLLKRIKEGRIEVTGMFFNFSEVVDETALAIQTHTLKYFKDNGIDVTTAMQNDVNGIGWCMIDLFNNTGVRYLTMGQHGHRAQVPFNKPTAFWWESPAGNRLLAYRSEHYMHGNALSLTSGNIDVFRDNLSEYLDNLEEKNYPFDRTAFQFSGYVTDNSPPSILACDIVKEWNEIYEWPKLKLSLASEFMVFIDENHEDHIETKKVAWPDWWTDGFGSAMNETKTSRSVHSEMIANMGLLSMARVMGAAIPKEINDEISRCYDNLLFYDEHTFGADESISNPQSENSKNQWSQKSSYVWSAAQQSRLLREKIMGLILPYIEKSELPTITVFNTLNWSRSGLVDVFIDHDILPLDKEFKIYGVNGKHIPAQLKSSRNEGSYWALWVQEIPPVGYATFKIEVQDHIRQPSGSAKTIPPSTLENNYYKLTFDIKEGCLSSIFDKDLQQELIDSNSGSGVGKFIYEQLESRHTMERLTNSNRDTVYVPLKKSLKYLTDVVLLKFEKGEIWQSIYLNGKIPECADEAGVNIEIRLFNHTKKIELLYKMRKFPKTTPEAVYIAFPFGMTNDDRLAFEAQGGTVYPGINQLEGTASDWNTIQSFATVINDESQIVFCSGDVPLVQFGNINTGRFYYRHEPRTSHIYSWVLNNYWTTNFKAVQEGELKWNYYITSSSDNSNSFATRFGWENRVKLLSRVIPKTTTYAEAVSTPLIGLDFPVNLLLVNAQPTVDGSGIIFHLRETEGDHAILDITALLQEPYVSSVSEVNVLGEKLNTLNEPIFIEHFETIFILIELNN